MQHIKAIIIASVLALALSGCGGKPPALETLPQTSANAQLGFSCRGDGTHAFLVLTELPLHAETQLGIAAGHGVTYTDGAEWSIAGKFMAEIHDDENIFLDALLAEKGFAVVIDDESFDFAFTTLEPLRAKARRCYREESL